ncbi:MAG: hypothetical protein PHR26_00440 [Candidatus ainarchaeum sp.]|nr:hypothetical protein [Candidatus ainarchaeum sp.]MDD3975681.1 hypothetical protein [Candidatus ainarchaeum sp.]
MITKNTTLKEILDLKNAEKVLEKYKVPCLSCPYAKMEMDTLEIGLIAEMYDLDLDNIIEELNKLKKIK